MNSMSNPPNQVLSQGTRTVLSFLLFLHLFALGVAIASNAGPVSALRRGLRRVPLVRSYLQILHMDLAYNFHLTYAEELDTDHSAELEFDWKGEPDASATKAVLPEPSLWPPLRRRRFHNLMRTAASLVEVPGQESELPYAIANYLLAANGVESGRHRFRCRRRYLLSRDEAKSIDPEESDPFHPRRFGTFYEADVKLEQGSLLLVKAAAAGESAPAQSNR